MCRKFAIDYEHRAVFSVRSLYTKCQIWAGVRAGNPFFTAVKQGCEEPLQTGTYHTSKQYTALQLLDVTDLIISTEEMNYMECKAEPAVLQYMSRDDDDDDQKPWYRDATQSYKPICNALAMVLETKSPDSNMSVDCTQEDLFHITNNSVTRCCIDYNQTSEKMIVSMEEIYDKDDGVHIASHLRATIGTDDFITSEEPDSKGIKSFISLDDGTTCNESTVGLFSSDTRNFNYSNNSYKSMIVGNSSLAGVYSVTDKPHKPQNHPLTLPHTASSTDDGPVKKHLVIGMYNYIHNVIIL